MALWFAVYPTGACVTDRTEIRGIVGIGASAGGLEALAELHRHATSGEYANWVRHVPTLADPERATPYEP